MKNTKPFRKFVRGWTKPETPAPAAKASAKIVGDPNLWITLQRVATDDGWTKTTRAMQTPAGVLINTCSRKANPPLVAEALQLLPGTTLQGAKIVPA